MPRIVKDPDERKQELLVTAMCLFAEEGYDNVSVRAVARAAGVAPGLAYHYFDSKQNMFDAAIKAYARRCAEGIIAILDDRSLSLDEKLDRALEAGSDHSAFDHAGFFHAEENGTLHDRLSLGMCEAVQPHLRAALELDALLRGMPPKDADGLASLMTYGCIRLVSGPGMPNESAMKILRRYFATLIAEFRTGEKAD